MIRFQYAAEEVDLNGPISKVPYWGWLFDHRVGVSLSLIKQPGTKET